MSAESHPLAAEMTQSRASISWLAAALVCSRSKGAPQHSGSALGPTMPSSRFSKPAIASHKSKAGRPAVMILTLSLRNRASHRDETG